MAEPMLAQVMAFGGSFAPLGWAKCNGTLLEIMQHSALYSVVGTLWGGDGRTTFALPDLRGRVPLGEGTGTGLTARKPGQKSGYERVTLVESQMPAHGHQMTEAQIDGDITCTAHAQNAEGDEAEAMGSILANQGSRVSSEAQVYSKTISGSVNMSASFVSASHSLTVSGETDAAGESQQHENMQPWTCINYIIALQGYYPSRS